MGLTFEWDEHKAEASVKKHGVGFPDAITAFFDPFSQTIHDSESVNSALRTIARIAKNQLKKVT